MGHYAIRDLFGHFVKPVSREGRVCPHKCCRGCRAHPADKPLIPDTAVLRALTDEQLARAVDWKTRGRFRR